MADPADPPVQAAVIDFAQRWRDLAADAAIAAGPTVVGADTNQLLNVMGEHAPHRHWAARVVKPEPLAAALNTAFGYDPPDTSAWVGAGEAILGGATPNRVGVVSHPFDLPGTPADEDDAPRRLLELLSAPHERPNLEGPFGLFGHLVRESVVVMRCLVGQAYSTLLKNSPVDPDAVLPLLPPDTDPWQTNLLMYGFDYAVDQLLNSDDPGAQIVAGRFIDWRERLLRFIETRWGTDPSRCFRALLATLDTQAFRVDPWLTGIADQRLRRMADDGAAFLLGAYGWVDRPRPAAGDPGDPPPPGPTSAGLLHTPSATQAAMAAVLRDAAVRHPGDPRWDIIVDSAKVRAAARLSERVRLSVHPHEALGLEVERLAGDWDTVRELRKAFPLVDSGEAQNRTVDGARALDAILRATEPVDPPLLGLADILRPLDRVLDTYADLLIADGVHAMVSGQAEIAHAAMQAAAGLGAPPEMRSIRTARSANEVRTTVLILLEAGDPAPDDPDPRAVADPAFTALVDEHTAGIPLGPARDAVVTRLWTLLGGGDDASEEPSLQAPIVADLTDRHQRVAARLADLRDEIAAVDPADAAALALARADTAMWAIDVVQQVDPGAWTADALTAIDRRLTEHGAPAASVPALRSAIRGLTGDPSLPVLPVIPGDSLPATLDAPSPDDAGSLDLDRLPIVAAVRPRLANLEAWQLIPARAWSAAVSEPGGGTNPWVSSGPVVVCYGPEPVLHTEGDVAVCVLDAWIDAVPQRRHSTAAAFGFNGPKSQAPQAVLLAVPPDSAQRLTNEGLARVVLETRRSVRARLADGLLAPLAAPPTALLSTVADRGFTEGWR